MGVLRNLTSGRVSRDSAGWHATMIADVRDVGGPADAREYNAILTQGVPQYGDPHPVIPGIRVVNVSASPSNGDSNVFDVEIEYGGDSSGSTPGLEGTGIKALDVNSTSIRTRGYRDVNGNLMIVTYQGEEFIFPGTQGGAFSPGTESGSLRFTFSTAPVEAEWDVPSVSVTVTTEQPIPSHLRTRQLAAHVNDGPWSGLGPYQWLTLGIDSSLNASGTHDWRSMFLMAPVLPDNDTWKFRAEYVWFGNALRTANTVGNGIEYFDLYRTLNFAQSFGFEIPG
jgi:hypothetical protein